VDVVRVQLTLRKSQYTHSEACLQCRQVAFLTGHAEQSA